MSNIPTSSKHRSLPHCCCTRHCHLEAQRRKQAPFHCWRRGTVQTYQCTVQYNMCAFHLVCMLTVISIGAHTVFPGLNLLFGRLRAEVGLSCTSEGSPAHSLPRELLPGLNQMASSSNTTEGMLSSVHYLTLLLRRGWGGIIILMSSPEKPTYRVLIHRYVSDAFLCICYCLQI